MIIAAISLEVSGAAKISAALFVVSWLLVFLTLYEARYLQRQKRRQSAGILLVLALIFGGSWWCLLSSPPASAEDIAKEVVKRIPNPAPVINSATVRIDDQRFAKTSFPLKTGQVVAVNFYPTVDAPGVAHNFHSYGGLRFFARTAFDEDFEKAADEMFRNSTRT